MKQNGDFMSKGFSTITVVYNDVSHIVETMDSVLGQTCKQIEYILIDGGSTDGTKEEIVNFIYSCANITIEDLRVERYYLEAIHKDHSELTFKFLSEKDGGIYDAMNKGVSLATKEWINFMNCRDKFYNSEVLEKISKENIERYDVIYGDTLITENSKTFLSVSSKNIKNRMPFCHQSSFVKTCILTSILFDTSYKICADNDFFMKLYHSQYKFIKIDIPISIYSLDGLSSSLSWQFFYEECKIGFKYNRFFPLYLIIKWILWTIPKKQIKKLFMP